MKKGTGIALLTGLVLIISTGCEKKQEQQTTVKPASEQPASAGNSISGTITDLMDAGGYTYFQLNTGDKKIWAAVTQRELSIGQNVTLGQSMKMTDFRSESLDRTFDTIYFVQNLVSGKESHKMTPEMAMDQLMQAKKHTEAPKPSDIDFSDVEIPSDGKYIADVYAEKNDLQNKMIRLRGKVVKFVPGVMGKNWIHLQDGSGKTGTNDITITTSENVSVGDLISVEGKLILDKDFGYGYKYDLIIEDALVIKK